MSKLLFSKLEGKCITQFNYNKVFILITIKKELFNDFYNNTEIIIRYDIFIHREKLIFDCNSIS